MIADRFFAETQREPGFVGSGTRDGEPAVRTIWSGPIGGRGGVAWRDRTGQMVRPRPWEGPGTASLPWLSAASKRRTASSNGITTAPSHWLPVGRVASSSSRPSRLCPHPMLARADAERGQAAAVVDALSWPFSREVKNVGNDAA